VRDLPCVQLVDNNEETLQCVGTCAAAGSQGKAPVGWQLTAALTAVVCVWGLMAALVAAASVHAAEIVAAAPQEVAEIAALTPVFYVGILGASTAFAAATVRKQFFSSELPATCHGILSATRELSGTV